MKWTDYARARLQIDAIGGALSAAVLAAAWFFVAAPWLSAWQTFQRLAVAHESVDAGLRAKLRSLDDEVRALADHETQVTELLASAPEPASLGEALGRITAAAEESAIQIQQVVPQPLHAEGAYVVADVSFSGRALSTDLVAFLERLAAIHPCQSVEQLSVGRGAETGDPHCNVNWTLRLYFLPETTTQIGGGA